MNLRTRSSTSRQRKLQAHLPGDTMLLRIPLRRPIYFLVAGFWHMLLPLGSTMLLTSGISTPFVHIYRELNMFECTLYIINLYLLLLAQKGRTFGTVEAFLSALSFCFQFYLVRDFVQDKMILDMKRFVAKVCTHGHNKKEPFGSTQVRLL